MFAFRAIAAVVLLTVSFAFADPCAARTPQPMFAPMTLRFHYAYTVYPGMMPRVDQMSLRGHPVASDRDGLATRALGFDAPLGVFPALWSPGADFAGPDIRVSRKFPGMAASSAICDGPCGGPGTDLAASKTWLFETVGSSFAVYSPAGVLQPNWPKNVVTFFSIPSPGPCDPTGPGFTFANVTYDPGAKRYVAFLTTVEGQFLGDSCPDSYQIYAGVSATSDPRGAWNVFISSPVPGDVVVLHVTTGITPQAVCLSGNVFAQASPQPWLGAAFGCANKTTFESTGGALNGFTTSSWDTLEPSTVNAPDPGAAIFIASQNQLAGSCIANPCSQYLIADMANPGSASPVLTTAVVTSPITYHQTALRVDQPGCSFCVKVSDTRVQPHPVLNNGALFFTHNTGLTHGAASVTGALWGQINVTFDSTTHGLTGASFFQGGVVKFAGDRSAASPALTADPNDNVVLVFNSVGSALSPSMQAASRLASTPTGVLSRVRFIVKGTAPTTLGSIIDYGGAMVDNGGNFWIAHSFSNGVWATEIAKVKP